MKFKEYLLEASMIPVQTKQDQTGHLHQGLVNESGDGETKRTIYSYDKNDMEYGGSDAEDHVHEIHQWLVQPAHGHVHNLEED